MDAFIGRVVTRHTSCRQNTMHEKLGARWSLLFDIKLAVKSYVHRLYTVPTAKILSVKNARVLMVLKNNGKLEYSLWQELCQVL